MELFLTVSLRLWVLGLIWYLVSLVSGRIWFNSQEIGGKVRLQNGIVSSGTVILDNTTMIYWILMQCPFHPDWDDGNGARIVYTAILYT